MLPRRHEAAPQEPARERRSRGVRVQKFSSRGYNQRVEMIPMRDGVKLKTLIFLPKGAQDAPMPCCNALYNAFAL